jgi:hypothetical protein
MKRFLAAALLAVLALPAHAETYRIDLIVFLDKFAGGESGRGTGLPNLANAIDSANLGALNAAGITLLPESAFALEDEWQHLRNSKRYQPLIKLAWTQKDPPENRGPALRVRFGQSFAIGGPDNLNATSASPVDGSIALLLGHYLHVDADLTYTVPTQNGFASYRLRENRKMKRDELHHLDSAKLGMLVKLSKPGGPADSR